MDENFPNLAGGINLQIQAEKTPNRKNSKKSMPKDIIKPVKIKDKGKIS